MHFRLAANHRDFPARYQLALLLFQSGRLPAALQAAEAALELNRESREALVLHSVVALESKRFADATGDVVVVAGAGSVTATVVTEAGSDDAVATDVVVSPINATSGLSAPHAVTTRAQAISKVRMRKYRAPLM